MKFDTINKKPNVYSIAVLSAVMAAACAGIVAFGGNRACLIVNILLSVYFAEVIIILMTAFFGQLKYNPYSYNIIYYSGFSLFCLTLLVSHIYLAATCGASSPGWEKEQINILLESAKNYVTVTSPFIAVFSVSLFISNISLIRHEGRRFVNILGIILSVLLAGGIFVVRIPAGRGLITRLPLNLFAALYLYFECMVTGTIIADLIAALHEPEKDKDIIIILGCSFRRDGTPTPLLRGRLDRAVRFYRIQKEKTGHEAILIPSGGKGGDEHISEAECMRRYLVSEGIPEDKIVMEDKSANTYENMLFSQRIADKINPKAKIAFSTTNFHVFRSGLMARRIKMRAIGMGSRTKWYFWPNAAVREFVGLLKGHRGKQALIIGSMIFLYTALTLIANAMGT